MTQCYMFPAILETKNLTESKYGSSSMFVCERWKVTLHSKVISASSAPLVVYREGEVVVVSAGEDNSVVDVESCNFFVILVLVKKNLICCFILKLNNLFQKHITQFEEDDMGVHNWI